MKGMKRVKKSNNSRSFLRNWQLRRLRRKKNLSNTQGFLISGGTDGTRTRDPCVTGRYSNRLNYRSTEFLHTTGLSFRLTA